MPVIEIKHYGVTVLDAKKSAGKFHEPLYLRSFSSESDAKAFKDKIEGELTQAKLDYTIIMREAEFMKPCIKSFIEFLKLHVKYWSWRLLKNLKAKEISDWLCQNKQDIGVTYGIQSTAIYED